MPPKSGSLGEFIAQVVRDAAPDALSLDEVLLRVANAGFESSITRPKDTKNNATSILKSNRGKLFHESMREGTDSAPPERVAEHDAQESRDDGKRNGGGESAPWRAFRGDARSPAPRGGRRGARRRRRIGLGHRDRGYRVGDDRRFRHARAPRL